METINFSKYGKSFQEKILQALFTDKAWAEQMLEVFDPEYFDIKSLQFLSERYFSYAKKYKDFPTPSLLITIVKDDLNSDPILKAQVVELIQRLRENPNPEDLPYVKDKSLDFCKRQALRGALEKAVDMIDKEQYESIVDIIKKAVSSGTSSSLGHNFFEEPDSRFLTIKRNCVPTGLAALDAKGILNGGAGKGELFVVVGATGAGKSHFLTFAGANALRAGKNVLHYTFELSEEQIGLRYDSNLCGINSSDVIENREKVLESYKNENYGKLMIKYFPTSFPTVNTLRAHVEKLKLKGFYPDVILVDYADIMRSTRQFDSLRHELKLVYEELRGLAGELGLPLWTASQSNKEGADSEVIDLTNMSEAYGKAFIADCVVTISRRSIEKATGKGRLFVAKNRFGTDGILFQIGIDTGTSTFTITSDQEIPKSSSPAEEEMNLKASIKEKWKTLMPTKEILPSQNAT